MRAALALDPTDGETRELAARWGITVSAVKPRVTPPPLPAGISGARPLPRRRAFPGADRSGPVSGLRASASPASRRSRRSPSSDARPTEVGRVLAQADVFVKYGLVERAVDHLRRVFALDPRHRGARERLASVLDAAGAAQRGGGGARDPGRPAGRGGRLRRGAGRGARADPGPDLAPRPPSCWVARSPRRPRPRRRRGAERRAARRSWSRSTSSSSSRCIEEARSVLDELAQRFPGDPAGRREARGDHARRATARRRRRRQGAIPGERAGPGPHAPVAKLSVSERADPRRTAISASPTRRWASTTRPSREFKLLLADRARGLRADDDRRVPRGEGRAGRRGRQVQGGAQPAAITTPRRCELYYLLG